MVSFPKNYHPERIFNEIAGKKQWNLLSSQPQKLLYILHCIHDLSFSKISINITSSFYSSQTRAVLFTYCYHKRLMNVLHPLYRVNT